MTKQMFLVHCRLEDGGSESFVEFGEEHLHQRIKELISWGYAANGIDIYTTVPYETPIEVSVVISPRFSA